MGVSFDAVFAAVMLAGDLGPMPTSAEIEALRSHLITLAIDAEILDHRERVTIFTTIPHDDLERMRRLSDLFASVPRVCEVERFPPMDVIYSAIRINRGVHGALHARLAVDLLHADEIRAGITACDRLYYAWDALRDARSEVYYAERRRSSLELLRLAIGDEAFYEGRMPAPAP